VCVHYRGTFLDGTEFDSSYSRNEATSFPSDGVIPGWVEALSLMKPGDAWRLAIHPDLAYGSRGIGPIPPNTALLFDVSLIRLLDGPPAPGVDCAA
jgi:FKBP-type peptidyl-prolyl cis-trans isomerase